MWSHKASFEASLAADSVGREQLRSTRASRSRPFSRQVGREGSAARPRRGFSCLRLSTEGLKRGIASKGRYFAPASRATSFNGSPNAPCLPATRGRNELLLGSSAAVGQNRRDARLPDLFKLHLANTGYFAWGFFAKLLARGCDWARTHLGEPLGKAAAPAGSR